MIVRQFSLYIAVGVLSALTDIGLMQLLISLDMNYSVAASFGFAVGLAVNFLLHSRVTFNGCFSFGLLVRYMCVVLVNYALMLAIVQLFDDWLSMPVLGKFVSLPVIAINGFFSSKYWIFKSRDT